MKEPTYRQTLVHAWEVVWHNKSLWILGLFSVLLGQFGFSDILGKVWLIADASTKGQVSSLLPAIKLNWSGDIGNVMAVFWLAIICLSLAIGLGFLAVTSQGALISYAAEWFKTKKHQSLAKPWQRGVKNFWSIFLINILRKVTLFVSLALFGFALSRFIYSQNLPEGLLLALSLAIVLFVSLFVSVISVFALCSLVIDSKGIKAAVLKACDIFARHILVSLEVGILLMLLNFLLVLIIAVGGFFAFLPAMLIFLAAGITSQVVLVIIGFCLGVFLWLVFIVVVAGIFNAYTTSAWVFLFIKMHKDGIDSRAVRFFKHIFGR